MKILEQFIPKKDIVAKMLNKILHDEYPEVAEGWQIVLVEDGWKYDTVSLHNVDAKKVYLRSPEDKLKEVFIPESIWGNLNSVLTVIAYKIAYGFDE